MASQIVGVQYRYFCDLVFSAEENNYDQIFDIFNAREIGARFRDLQISLPKEEINQIGAALGERLSAATERTALLQYPDASSQQEQQMPNIALSRVERNPLECNPPVFT